MLPLPFFIFKLSNFIVHYGVCSDFPPLPGLIWAELRRAFGIPSAARRAETKRFGVPVAPPGAALSPECCGAFLFSVDFKRFQQQSSRSRGRPRGAVGPHRCAPPAVPPFPTLYIKGIVLIFQSRVLSVAPGGTGRRCAGRAGGGRLPLPFVSLRAGRGRAGSALPVPAGRSGGAASGSDGMARSTLSSRFRRLDIDQYDENRFVEEPEEAAAAEPDASPEVEALLRQYPSGGSGPGRAAVRGPGNVTGTGARPAAARRRPPHRPRSHPVPRRRRPAAVVSAPASPRQSALLPPPPPRVPPLLLDSRRRGEALRALHAALRSAPAQTRSAALKVSAAPGPAPVTSGISRRGAPRAPSSCSAAPPGRPLLKNGGVICARGQPRAAACHSAQGAARGVGKRARQHLMAERKS